MKWFKIILPLFLALYVFIGAAGVIVFEHICKKDGRTISFYLPVQHECHDKVIDLAPTCESKSCCSKSANNPLIPQFTKVPCCQELINYVHFDQDWNSYETVLVAQILNRTPVLELLIPVILLEEKEQKYEVRPPPSLHLNERLALLQTYLI
jgi:hypothetical protein